MTRKPTIRSRMMLLPLLGSLLVGGSGVREAPTLSVGSRSAVAYQLPAPRQTLVTVSSWLTPPLPDRRLDGDAGSRLSGSGSRLALHAGPKRLYWAPGASAPTRSVPGHATSVGSRLLGLSAFPANAPPAP